MLLGGARVQGLHLSLEGSLAPMQWVVPYLPFPHFWSVNLLFGDSQEEGVFSPTAAPLQAMMGVQGRPVVPAVFQTSLKVWKQKRKSFPTASVQMCSFILFDEEALTQKRLVALDSFWPSSARYINFPLCS